MDTAVTIKSLYNEELQRFKLDGTPTLAGIRAELRRRHSGLPENYQVKYEWGKGLATLGTESELERAIADRSSDVLRLYLSDLGATPRPPPSATSSAVSSAAASAERSSSSASASGGLSLGLGQAPGRSSRMSSATMLSPHRGMPAPMVAPSGGGSPFFSALPETPTGAEKELVLKIMVVGNAACGKTSIINRFVNNVFSENYKSTVGADFSRKIIQWDDSTTVRLQLWDIAGQDRFAAVTRAFYKNAVGAIVVCDVTREATLEAVASWKAEIDSKVMFKNGMPVPAVLLVNKVDLLTDAEESFKIGASFEKVATECGFTSWFITSAKTNHNINEAMRLLIAEIFQTTAGNMDASMAKRTITLGKAAEEEDGACC